MKCPKCGTPAPDGATHCRRCGKAIAAGASEASDSENFELELKPLEPSKPPAHSDFEPPPELMGPPPPQASRASVATAREEPIRPEKGLRPRGANAIPTRNNRTPLLALGVVAGLLVIWLGWRIFRTENKLVSGRGKVEQTLMLMPNQPKIENLEISGKINYSLELNSLDASILVGMVQRDPHDPARIADLKKLTDPLETLGKGQSRTLGGELKSGKYSWVLINEGKKPVRVKVKFNAG